MLECPTENITLIDQSHFWDPDGGVTWDAHRIGWAIAGVSALITTCITLWSVWRHFRSYTVPREQRQIIRILYMPMVYAIISFFSYRFFRDYTYYSLVEIAYEAVTITAFLMLIIEYVASSSSTRTAEGAMARKDKRPLPFPFCCWRYRPTKAYFLYTVKWSVMQYVIVRPLCSVAGIVCEYFHILCETEGFNPHFASVYLSSIAFVSITIALYGLLLFYGLTKEELNNRRPLAKFMCIKLIVMFTFYQAFVFKLLEGKVIKATNYWTETNITNGLNALAICIEMVFFAIGMAWAYPVSEYRQTGKYGHAQPTSIWRPILDSLNPTDFVREIWGSLTYYVGAAGKHERVEAARGLGPAHEKPNFATAFGIGPQGSNLLPTSDHDVDVVAAGAYDLQEFDRTPRISTSGYGFRAPQNSYGSGAAVAAGAEMSPQTAMFSPGARDRDERQRIVGEREREREWERERSVLP
ncbi:hypothetical protein MKEN_00455600 [Mycena kentingensis (nom. inval.)]|nr:hypothetical protein MKEN_00455600 [Mycena kentingensis (nom. inval.)]